jgi:hypothetical protein
VTWSEAKGPRVSRRLGPSKKVFGWQVVEPVRLRVASRPNGASDLALQNRGPHGIARDQGGVAFGRRRHGRQRQT